MSGKVTIKDVASHAGVGVSTVSAVLSNKTYCYVSDRTRAKIVAAAKELRYVPSKMSRALQGMSTETVGIIGSVFTVPIHTRFISHLSRIFWEHEYQVLLGDSYGDRKRERVLMKEFVARGIDGFVISGNLSREEIVKEVGATPFVVSGTLELNPRLELGVDNLHGGYVLMNHLLAEGASKFVFFTSELGKNQSKRDGCLKAIEMKSSRADVDVIDNGERDLKVGLAEALNLMKNEAVDAFVCSNDILAAKLTAFLMREGFRVPADVLVTGYDGVEISELFHPSITTVAQPMEELAANCFKSLSIKMKSSDRVDDEIEQRLFKPELIIRDSSRRDPAMAIKELK